MICGLVGSPMGPKDIWKAPVCFGPLDEHRTYPCLQEAEASFPSPTWQEATFVLWIFCRLCQCPCETKISAFQQKQLRINKNREKSIKVFSSIPDLSRATLHAGSHRHVICQHVVQVQVSHLLATLCVCDTVGLSGNSVETFECRNLIKSDKLEIKIYKLS